MPANSTVWNMINTIASFWKHVNIITPDITRDGWGKGLQLKIMWEKNINLCLYNCTYVLFSWLGKRIHRVCPWWWGTAHPSTSSSPTRSPVGPGVNNQIRACLWCKEAIYPCIANLQQAYNAPHLSDIQLTVFSLSFRSTRPVLFTIHKSGIANA